MRRPPQGEAQMKRLPRPEDEMQAEAVTEVAAEAVKAKGMTVRDVVPVSAPLPKTAAHDSRETLMA
jgi:hypothetical protein